MGPAVHEDLPVRMNVPLEQEEDVRRGLHDAPRIGRDARHAGRQAIQLGIVLRLQRLHLPARLGQQRERLAGPQALGDVGDGTAALPHT